ncbi:hypothetical protein CSHISOI_05300, partial [Colletotrichum shisoi]
LGDIAGGLVVVFVVGPLEEWWLVSRVTSSICPSSASAVRRRAVPHLGDGVNARPVVAYPVVDVVGEDSSGDGTGCGDEDNGREARLDLHPCLSGLSLASVFGEVVDSLRGGGFRTRS